MFGKTVNTSKFITTINSALVRIAILKKQHQARWSQARSDVVQLLSLGHRESAILRVDHVIREQNLLDALVIIEGYCCLLLERVALIRNALKCPEELKEAIASLVFAASRYGQLPELQKISRIFMKKYGKEFVNYAVELRNSCGVNAKIAKRLPNTRTSLGSRIKVLKEIAAEHRITLQPQDGSLQVTDQGEKSSGKSTHMDTVAPHKERESPEEKRKDEIDPKAENRHYTNAEQAAQAACNLATQAAVAAKAAVELSHTKPRNHHHSDNHPGNLVANHSKDASSKEAKQRKTNEEEEGIQKNDVLEACFRKLNFQVLDKSFRSKREETGPSNKIETEKKRIPYVFTSESDADDEKQAALKIPLPREHPSLEHHKWDYRRKFGAFLKSFDAGKDGNQSTEGSSRGRRPIPVRTRRTSTPRRSRRPLLF